MTTDDDEMREDMAKAIADVIARHGGILTRWVLVAEIVDEDDRTLWLVAPEDQKAWEGLGMLRFAEHVELAARIRSEDES